MRPFKADEVSQLCSEKAKRHGIYAVLDASFSKTAQDRASSSNRQLARREANERVVRTLQNEGPKCKRFSIKQCKEVKGF
jgi:hypothetical protein